MMINIPTLSEQLQYWISTISTAESIVSTYRCTTSTKLCQDFRQPILSVGRIDKSKWSQTWTVYSNNILVPSSHAKFCDSKYSPSTSSQTHHEILFSWKQCDKLDELTVWQTALHWHFIGCTWIGTDNKRLNDVPKYTFVHIIKPCVIFSTKSIVHH